MHRAPSAYRDRLPPWLWKVLHDLAFALVALAVASLLWIVLSLIFFGHVNW